MTLALLSLHWMLDVGCWNWRLGDRPVVPWGQLDVPPFAFPLRGLSPWPLPSTGGDTGRAMAAFFPLADFESPTAAQFWPWLLCGAAVVASIGAIFFAWNQAKEALGRKPAMDDEVAELKRKIDDDLVTHEDLDTRLTGFASEIELKIERALHAEFQKLTSERSQRDHDLYKKIDASGDGLRAEINDVREALRRIPAEVLELLRGGNKRQ